MPVLQLTTDEARAAMLSAFTDKFPEHTGALTASGIAIEVVSITHRLDEVAVVEVEVPEVT